MAESVNVTFALWREEGGMLRMVNRSDFAASLRAPGVEHRFSCEAWSMEGCGVEVMEKDMVGVVIDPHSVSIDVVGEVEGEEVMVRSDFQVGDAVNRSSMEKMGGVGLLIFTRIG